MRSRSSLHSCRSPGRPRSLQAAAGRAGVRVVERIDPPHRRHRPAFLVGVGQDRRRRVRRRTGRCRDRSGTRRSPRTAAIVPSMLIGSGRPTRPRQAGLDGQRRGDVLAGDAGLLGDRHDAVEPGIAASCAGGVRNPAAAGPAGATRRRPRRPPARGRRRHVRPFDDGGDRRPSPTHGGSVEFAERQHPGGRRRRERWRRRRSPCAPRARTAVPAPWSMLATITASIEPGGGRVGQFAGVTAGGRPTGTARCRRARRGRSRGWRCCRRWLPRARSSTTATPRTSLLRST